MANEVHDALKGVHRRFLVLVAVGGVGLLLCFPRPSDGRRLELAELTDEAVAQLDPKGLEAEIVLRATEQGAMDLAELAGSLDAPGVRGVRGGDVRASLSRARPVKIQNLGAAFEQSQRGQEVTVVGPERKSIVAGLRWRIGRGGRAVHTRLVGIRLLPGGASQAALDLEASVEPLRLRAIAARRAYDKDRVRHGRLKRRVKEFVKTRRTRKKLWRLKKQRQSAYEKVEVSALAMEQALTAYREGADRALAFDPEASDGPGAVVVIRATVGDKSVPDMAIPVPRREAVVLVPPVAVPAALGALSQASLWRELRGETFAGARARAREGLSWHTWGTEVGGLSVGGATVLHLYPLLLIAVAVQIVRQCRKVRQAFSPFNHPGAELPRVGTGSYKIDILLIVLTIALVVAVDVWTTLSIRAGGWLSSLFGLGALVAAVIVARQWYDLEELCTNIVQSSGPTHVQGGWQIE